MRYLVLLVVLFVGCVGNVEPLEPRYINAKGGFFDEEFPEVDGYEFINLIRIETDDEFDEERSVVTAATYVGAPVFTYTIQKLNYAPDLGGLNKEVVGGESVYYWYDGEIPFVKLSASNVVWVDGNVLYSISAKNQSLIFDAVEAVLDADDGLDYNEYGFLNMVELLPEPLEPWELYSVNAFKKLGYDLSSGYYITDDLKRVDLLILRGDVDYVVNKMVEGLVNSTGSKIGGFVLYEGEFSDGLKRFYRKIYKLEDIGVIVSTPSEQREENMGFIDYLIEKSGATR